MSSSDQVRTTYKKEVVMGQIDVAGNIGTARVLSDSLSGTPRTAPTDEVGSGDRQSTGQDVVGLDVNGGFAVKLSPDPFHDDMIEAAMMSLWSVAVKETAISITLDVAAGTITKTGGTDFTTIFSEGDMLTLSGMDDEVNNGMVYVVAVAADVLTVIMPDMMVDGIGAVAGISLDPYVEIGSEDITYSFMKDFLDLTQKSITYLGKRSSGFNFNFTFGEHVTGDYSFAGTDWRAPVTPDSDGRTIDPIGEEPVLNASQDVGLVVVDGAAVDFCIKTLNIGLDNGLQPIECVGSIAPRNQEPGDAAIAVSMEAYLADTNFDLVRDKIANNPISISYSALNENGKGYAFQMPAVRLAFPDPGNEGKGSRSMLNMEGVAEKSVAFGNTLRVYKVGG